jgi:hypothetical protein
MNTSLGLLQSVGIGFAAIVLVAVVAVILFILTSAIKIVKEYERGSSSGSVGCRGEPKDLASSS